MATLRKKAQREGLDIMEVYWREIGQCEPLSREEEARLVRRARAGEVEAMQKLVAANLRFVVRVAREYAGSGMELDELISEGNLGLMQALPRFDESRGLKFITYAVWWIRQAMLKAIDRSGRDVRPPVNHLYDLRKVERQIRCLGQELGRSPTREEVIKRTGFAPERIENALAAGRRHVHLDLAAYDGDEDSLLDRLADEEDVEERMEGRELSEVLRESMLALNARERRIVSAYFGLDGEQALSLEKIGQKLGLTRERVRQIRDQALERMRICSGNRLIEFCRN